MTHKQKPVTSLNSLVRGLMNRYVIVELRNEATVNGQITEVDICMNIVMADAIFSDPNGNEYYYDTFFIRERNIRYIQIPSEEDIEQLLLKSLEKLSYRPKKVMTLKTSRLMERQKETLKRVEEIKKAKLEKQQLKLEKSNENK